MAMVEAERLARQLGAANTRDELEAAQELAAAWLSTQPELESPAPRLVLDALHTAAHRAEELGV